LQEIMHEEIRAAGGWVEVAQDMETVDRLLNLLL